MSLRVSSLERGVVRIFALSMTDAEAEALRDAVDPAVFGLEQINGDYIEIFPVSDLTELGLDGFLEAGHGIEPKDLDPDRAKLRALDGWILLATSQAFAGIEAELRLAPELTLIGSYQEPLVDWSSDAPLVSQAASGTSSPPKSAPSDAAMSGRIAMLALIVIFALTAVMVLIAA